MKKSVRLLASVKQLSYAHKPSLVPYLSETVGQRLRSSVEAVPDKTYCVFPKQSVRVSYQKLYADSQKLAASLIGLGLKPGDRVGIWGPNYYEWLQTHFACSLAGFILVNVNPFYRVPELQFALRKVGVAALITPSEYKHSDYYDSICEVVPEIVRQQAGHGAISSHLLPSFKHLIVFDPADPANTFNGAWNFADFSKSADSNAEKKLAEHKGHFDEAFNIQFTSGTTGYPKAVTLTHFNVLNNANLAGLNSNFDKTNEIICVPNPLYHTFGCVAGVLNALIHKQSLVFPSETFSAAAALEAIQAEKATFVYGTPTMFIDMLNHDNFANTDVSSLGGAYISAAPVPRALAQKMLDKMNLTRMQLLYGCTETSPVITCSTLEQAPEERIKNCGYTLDHCETVVVDRKGKAVPRGERGELMTRGFLVMQGYWGEAEKTAEVITDSGWYKTGDVAVMHDDGAISIVGRNKDLIIRGGENVYPTEVEGVIFRHPRVADVHVIGVPDHRLGEEICAWVRLKESEHLTADELREYCKDKMARHSIPRYILFKTEHEFPLTATGKVQKFEMRNISKRELGLEHVESHFNE